MLGNYYRSLGHTMSDFGCEVCFTDKGVVGPCRIPHKLEEGKLTLQEFWHAQADWSQHAFGLDPDGVVPANGQRVLRRGPAGPLKHLRKEIKEVAKDVTDVEEWADCEFLIFDSARRAGFKFEELRKCACESQGYAPLFANCVCDRMMDFPEILDRFDVAAQRVLDDQQKLECYGMLQFFLHLGMDRAGISLASLLAALNAKLIKNRDREWQTPTTDEPVEHVRDDE